MTHPFRGTPTLLRTARATFARAVHRALAEDGFDDVPRTAAAVLAARPTSAADVLATLRTTKQAASQLVDTLVLRGYLERRPHPTDRRRTGLAVTERGNAAADAVVRGVREVEHAVLRHVPEADWETTRRVLGVVADLDDEPTSTGASTARVHRLDAVLPVTDLDRAAAHYRSLGFAVELHEGGGYGYARRGGAGLHLNQVPDLDPATTTSAVYLLVDDADALAREWQAAGVAGETRAPVDTDYRLREGAHLDPDRNLLRFGSPLPAAPTA